MQKTYTREEFHLFIMNYISTNMTNKQETNDEKWNTFLKSMKSKGIDVFLRSALLHDNIRYDSLLFSNNLSTKERTTVIV